MKDKFTFSLVLGGLLLAATASFAADSILDGPKPSSCADSPDYVPGVDANGRSVARADEGAQPVPVPGQILVPLSRQRGQQRGAQRGARRGGQAGGDPTYTVLDGKRLDPLVNPAAMPCPARH